jgi:hypothetical protein
MSYVKSFKSFQNAEKKASEEISVESGANPVVTEQTAPAAAPATPTDTTQNQADPATTPAEPPMVEADPAVIAARSALATASANRDRAVAAKQAELEKLKSDQNVVVNNATTALNGALQKAATSK